MSWCRVVVRKRNHLGEKPGKEEASRQGLGSAGLGSLAGEREGRVEKERRVAESKEEPKSPVLLPGPSSWQLQNSPTRQSRAAGRVRAPSSVGGWKGEGAMPRTEPPGGWSKHKGWPV